MSTKNATPNHELLHFLDGVQRTRRSGRTPAYSPPDVSREEKLVHLLRMTRTKFPYQACPIAYAVWVIDGMVKRPLEQSPALKSGKALLQNKRFKEALLKKNQRLVWVPGKGKDAGYRLNVDDNDLATGVLASDKRRASTALHRAAQTHMMIDEAQLTLPEAREVYEEVGGMVDVLSTSGILKLEDLSTDAIKRLQTGMTERKGRTDAA